MQMERARSCMSEKASLSILIPVRDEERNLPECLASVDWADEVVVLDSGSRDRTVEIARAAGARLLTRAFDDFATHKNWALEHGDFRHPWVFILDADERITPELSEELRRLLDSTPSLNGYYVARKNMFLGRWMRHGGWWPDWQLRLIRLGRARYESRLVHEHMLMEGQSGFLHHPLIHHDFKGIERYIERHNIYSSLEAVEAYRARRGAGASAAALPSGALSKGPARRRRLKTWAYRWLPFRPFFKFVWMYLLRAGFLDGRLGLRFSVLHAIYEYQVSLKIEELERPDSPMRAKYGDRL